MAGTTLVEVVADGGLTMRGVASSGSLLEFGDRGRVDEDAPCITVASANRVEILNCHIDMADMLSFSFAVVLRGEDLSMRGSIVAAEAAGRVSGTLSGINIRSGSRDVEII